MTPAYLMMMSKRSGEVIQSLAWDQMLTPTQGENGVRVGSISYSTLTGFRTSDLVWSSAVNGYVAASGYTGGMTFRLPDPNNGGRIGISGDTSSSSRLICAEITVPSNGLWRIEMDNLRISSVIPMFWSIMKDQIVYAASPLYSNDSPTPITPQWRSMVVPCVAGDKIYLIGGRKGNRTATIHYVDGLRFVKVASTPSIYRLSEHIPPLQQGGIAGPFYWGWCEPIGNNPEHQYSNYSWRSDKSEARDDPASYAMRHDFERGTSNATSAGLGISPTSMIYNRLWFNPGTLNSGAYAQAGVVFFPPSPGTWCVSVVNVCRQDTSPTNTDATLLHFYHTQLTAYGKTGNLLHAQSTSIFREAAQGRITVISPEYSVSPGGRIYVASQLNTGSSNTGRLVHFDDIICEKIG